LAGIAYTLPYMIVGLFAGAITHKVNRKLMLGVMMIIGSLSTFLTGSVNSFPLLCAMRVLHGSMNSATSPLTYSLVADYIPPERRATANSILSSAIYIGIAMSSISIMLIQKTGWRLAF
jgi:MFS family permease